MEMEYEEYEKAVRKAQDLWSEGFGDYFTDSPGEYEIFYERRNGNLYFVPSCNEVFDGLVDDIENGLEIEEEDIVSFLNHHGIEWK